MVNLALCVAGEQPPAWWGGQEWGWPGLLLSCNLHSLSRQFQRADVLEHQLKIETESGDIPSSGKLLSSNNPVRSHCSLTLSVSRRRRPRNSRCPFFLSSCCLVHNQAGWPLWSALFSTDLAPSRAQQARACSVPAARLLPISKRLDLQHQWEWGARGSLWLAAW